MSAGKAFTFLTCPSIPTFFTFFTPGRGKTSTLMHNKEEKYPGTLETVQKKG